MSPSAKKNNRVPDPFKRSWGWLLGLGIIFIILGCIGLGMTVSLTLASILLLGVLFIIAGVAQLIDVFNSRQWHGTVWHGLIAILYLIGGGIVIYDPIMASIVFTAIFAWVLIVMGIARFIMAIALRHTSQWAWLFFAGLSAIILGLLILMQWPTSGLWIIGLFIAIELIINGWSYVFIAFGIRKAT